MRLESKRGAQLARPARRRKISEKSQGEELMALHIKLDGLPQPEREYRFHLARQWRFDFAYPKLKVAIEVDGGVYTKGRHTRGAGFEDDCEKMAWAAILGWFVIRVSTGQVKKGIAIDMLTKLLISRSEAI